MDRIDVSVLVPVLDEERHVRDAAAAMRAQEFDGSAEFIFVDGGSSDRTPEILRELAAEDARVKLLDNPQRSTPIALNIGLRAARGDYVARMDAHTHYPPNYLATGVARLRRGDVAHVSGPQLAEGDSKWSRRVALALSTRLGTGGASFRHSSEAEFDVDSGFTGVWTRATLDAHDGWDEGWPNDQDSELAARIRADGGRIVCLPEMGARYIPRDSLRALARQYWRYGLYRAKTSQRHPESMRRSHVLAPGLALALVGALLLPRPLRRLARTGVAAYALAVLGVSAEQLLDADPVDALWLPAVFVCMHVPYGFGFLTGSIRFGAPLKALPSLLRGNGH
jgi:glycosyltransferase involved in cell wall biosynthesis